MSEKGFGLLKIIIASTIISIALFTLIRAAQISFKITEESALSARADFLLKEGIEAIHTIRDSGWEENIAPLSGGQTYYLTFSAVTNQWTTTTSNPGTIDGIFTRTLSFEDVYRRNSDRNIVDSASPDPKTIDPETKKMTVFVSWVSIKQTTALKSDSSYIADLFDN